MSQRGTFRRPKSGRRPRPLLPDDASHLSPLKCRRRCRSVVLQSIFRWAAILRGRSKARKRLRSAAAALRSEPGLQFTLGSSAAFGCAPSASVSRLRAAAKRPSSSVMRGVAIPRPHPRVGQSLRTPLGRLDLLLDSGHGKDKCNRLGEAAGMSKRSGDNCRGGSSRSRHRHFFGFSNRRQLTTGFCGALGTALEPPSPSTSGHSSASHIATTTLNVASEQPF